MTPENDDPRPEIDYEAISKAMLGNIDYAAMTKAIQPNIDYAAMTKAIQPNIDYAAIFDAIQPNIDYAAIFDAIQPNIDYAAITAQLSPANFAALETLLKSSPRIDFAVIDQSLRATASDEWQWSDSASGEVQEVEGVAWLESLPTARQATLLVLVLDALSKANLAISSAAGVEWPTWYSPTVDALTAIALVLVFLVQPDDDSD